MSSLTEQQEAIIEEMLGKYENEPSHCRQVTRLALILFDELKGKLHNYGKKERTLLKFGSLLHDIGYYISWDKHNKHAYDIIMSTQMPNFIDQEVEIIANIARYHRGKTPKEKHKNYAKVTSSNARTLIKELSAILRIADGLDRSHTDVIQDIKVVYDDYDCKCTFYLVSRSINCPGEMYAANKKKDLFEQEFHVNAEFIVQQV